MSRRGWMIVDDSGNTGGEGVSMTIRKEEDEDEDDDEEIRMRAKWKETPLWSRASQLVREKHVKLVENYLRYPIWL